jgi:hypothetical protein
MRANVDESLMSTFTVTSEVALRRRDYISTKAAHVFA